METPFPFSPPFPLLWRWDGLFWASVRGVLSLVFPLFFSSFSARGALIGWVGFVPLFPPLLPPLFPPRPRNRSSTVFLSGGNSTNFFLPSSFPFFSFSLSSAFGVRTRRSTTPPPFPPPFFFVPPPPPPEIPINLKLCTGVGIERTWGDVGYLCLRAVLPFFPPPFFFPGAGGPAGWGLAALSSKGILSLFLLPFFFFFFSYFFFFFFPLPPPLPNPGVADRGPRRLLPEGKR